jgi:hypothetical protein
MWQYVTVSVDTKARPMSGWMTTDPPDLKGVPWVEVLSRLGAEGWELAAAVPEFMKTYTSLEHAHFVFKRPA